MIGVTELASAAVGLLAPFVAKGAEELAESFGGEIADRLVQLYDSVKARLTGAAAKEALADLEAKPEDDRRKAALELQLEKALDADLAFREEVARLIGEIKAKGEGDVISQIANVTGDQNRVAQIAGSHNKVTF